MADKIHKSYMLDEWAGYWAHRSIEKELDFCRTDGLLPVFERFLSKNGLILEAGCGLGKWVVYFKNKGFKTIGIDSNLGCLSRVKEYDKGTRIIAGNVESLPIKNNSLSAYISLGVIEHFEDGPDKILKEARRVLGKGGMVFVEVPYLNLLRKMILPFKQAFRIMRRKLKMQPEDYHFAEFRFTKTELKRFLKTAGFEVIFTWPKDDILPNRNIGLWLDFPFVRARGKEDSLHELNKFGRVLSFLLGAISPWISCACLVCVGRKR